MAQATGGQNIFFFDEIGLFNHVWQVEASGRGSEQTAALTSIYDGQSISRSFIGDEYSAQVKRPIWNVMLLCQHEPLSESLANHQTSGLVGRFGMAECTPNPNKIHENRLHFTTSEHNELLDKFFGGVMNNAITNVWTETVATRLSSQDHHIVFRADPATEIYLFTFNVFVKCIR